MAKKQQTEECPKCMPGWLAAFGDLMSLLLCFFVLLLSMSSMDARKVEDAIGSLAGALSVLEGGSKTEISREQQQQDNIIKKSDQSSSSRTIQAVKNALKSINEMLQSTGSPKVTLEESQDGFVIELPASMLFKPDSAKITNDDALLFLRRIALIIEKMPRDVMLNIIGHTDDVSPSKGSNFPTNWELSTARAVSVAQELILAKVLPQRITVSGRSKYNPIATNATEEGRAKNRRVQLHFYSNDEKNERKARQTVLDTAKSPK